MELIIGVVAIVAAVEEGEGVWLWLDLPCKTLKREFLRKLSLLFIVAGDWLC
jgi:hypothetical protein